MTETLVTYYSENHSFRNENKFIYNWNIQGFCCPEVGTEEDMPTSRKFEFKFCSDYKFYGNLSIEGESCETRRCRLALDIEITHATNCTSSKCHCSLKHNQSDQIMWNVYVNLWLDEERQKSDPVVLTNANSFASLNLWDSNKNCRLNEGNSTIMCEIIYVNYEKAAGFNFAVMKQSKYYNHRLGELFENRINWDVTLVVGERKLHAHKCILANSSKVFDEMFKNITEKSNFLYTIFDIEFEVITEMIRYIYIDEVLNFNEVAVGLLAASDRFDLPKLKSMCELELSEHLLIATAADTYLLADRCRAEKLRKNVAIFIKRYKKTVAETEGWKKAVNENSNFVAELYLEMLK